MFEQCKGDIVSRFLKEEAVLRLLDYKVRNVTPPHQIRELAREIEEETRSAELKAVSLTQVDMAFVHKIVRMKLRLDNLYADWAEGKLDGPVVN